MAKAGKTLTVFLLVISVLLLSLTTITIYFFQKERDMRQTAENKLAETMESNVKLGEELKDARKQAFLFEENRLEVQSGCLIFHLEKEFHLMPVQIYLLYLPLHL